MEEGSREWASLKKLIKEADVIIEIVDARDVPGTRLPIAERMAGTSRLLVVANKADLLHEGESPELPKHGIAVSATKGGEADRKKLLRTILGRTRERPAKALLLGYPNVGKSTIINLLAGKKAARVSPIAGTTKNVQWVKVGASLLVTDYRGVHPKKEKRKELARKGAINIQRDAERYAHEFGKRILGDRRLRGWAEKRFGIDLSKAKDSDDILAAIAERRGFYLKGGELNLGEAARALVRAMQEAPEI
jgi:ribosome biogenesis GTPase A